jgi:methylmalonyl-CoA/ethylmalonyl-CoA epimerase
MLLTIDHVGIACRDLDAAIERYVTVFGLSVVAQEINTDQGVREAMLATESGTSYVQLLQPLSPDTAVGKFIEKRGEGMHHVGYAVADVSAALSDLGATGIRLIDSRPRHGSMGASIAFLHPKDLGGVLTELVQPSPGGTTPRTPREPDGPA